MNIETIATGGGAGAMVALVVWGINIGIKLRSRNNSLVSGGSRNGVITEHIIATSLNLKALKESSVEQTKAVHKQTRAINRLCRCLNAEVEVEDED